MIMKNNIIYLSLCCILVGCSANYYNLITSEYDEFKKVKRVKITQKSHPFDKKSVVSSVVNTYVGEISADGERDYVLYTDITKRSGSFHIEDLVYMSIDGNVIEKSISSKQTDDFVKRSENTDSVMTADSSTVRVVTGYSESHYSKDKIELSFTAEEVRQIMDCEELLYKYYFGPEAVTIKIYKYQLDPLKDFFSTH